MSLNSKQRWRIRAITMGGVVASILLVAGCSGKQSTLDTGGVEAEAVFSLLKVTTFAGVLIWLAVMALMLFSVRPRAAPMTERAASRLVLWCGALVPALLLFLLLAYALWLMPTLRPWQKAGAGTVAVAVTGEQFWWRVDYAATNGRPAFTLANEIRLPIGERVVFTLRASDVIHSFWIPALGGKMDMIPGRTNILTLEATRPGIYRAPCAEFCGTSHALMAFSVIVMEKPAFEEWALRQAVPATTATAAGHDLFMRHGCAACHTIHGTRARGLIGPDLSHLGSRLSLGAGVLENSQAEIARFIRDPSAIKPSAHMPAFTMLPPGDLEQIAAYLEGLQ